MAGIGKRFQDAGFTDPKPFIDVNGLPMIETVLGDLLPKNGKHAEYRFIIVTQSEFFNKYLHTLVGIKALFNKLEYYTVDHITSGPADTCMIAKALINTHDRLLIANCDQLVNDPGYIDRMINYADDNNADGGILCHVAKHKKWSFVDVKDDSRTITKCVEKEPISPLATTGHYYFRHGYDFVSAAQYILDKKILSSGESYVSNVIQHLIEQNKKFVPYVINEFYPIGTPEDLKIYLDKHGQAKS